MGRKGNRKALKDHRCSVDVVGMSLIRDAFLALTAPDMRSAVRPRCCGVAASESTPQKVPLPVVHAHRVGRIRGSRDRVVVVESPSQKACNRPSEALSATTPNDKPESPRTPKPTAESPKNRDVVLAGDDELNQIALGEIDGATVASRLMLPVDELSTRNGARLVEASLAQRLDELKQQVGLSRHEYVLRVQQILNDVVHELTRQVSLQCADRGRLLAKAWVRYTDVVNVLMELHRAERQRHQESEEKLQDDLRRARVDYVTVVKHMEHLVLEQDSVHNELLEEQRKRETELCRQIAELKEALWQQRQASRQPQHPDEAHELTAVSEQQHVQLKERMQKLKCDNERQKLLLIQASQEIEKLRARVQSVDKEVVSVEVMTDPTSESPPSPKTPEARLSEARPSEVPSWTDAVAQIAPS